MMPIVNSVFMRKKLFMSEFFCPNCLVSRPYNFQPMSEEETFCLIPFLETSKPDHIVKCQSCRNAFHPEILERSIQNLFRLAGAAKCKLDQGFSPGYLKLQFLNDGLQESLADRLINIALHTI